MWDDMVEEGVVHKLEKLPPRPNQQRPDSAKNDKAKKEEKLAVARSLIAGPLPSRMMGDTTQDMLYTASKITSLIRRFPVEIRCACRSSRCLENRCQCGDIGRIPREDLERAPTEAKLAVAALNTHWLQRCDINVMSSAARSLADLVAPSTFEESIPRLEIDGDDRKKMSGQLSGNSLACEPKIAAVRMVMAYTEILLDDIRGTIGTGSVWDGPASQPFTDFGPVVLGS
jgi:hypothetical protein